MFAYFLTHLKDVNRYNIETDEALLENVHYGVPKNGLSKKLRKLYLPVIFICHFSFSHFCVFKSILLKITLGVVLCKITLGIDIK